MHRKRGTPPHLRLLDILIGARVAKGLTQAELAERLERPQSYVSKVETGERRLDVVEMIYLCREIDVDPVELVEAVALVVEESQPRKVTRRSRHGPPEQKQEGRRGPRKKR